ncbi:hypothetical protein INR49_023439 [Caranx melampygus]|nr:hypothetical protein INR49_023439 [Caranx melampygus]
MPGAHLMTPMTYLPPLSPLYSNCYHQERQLTKGPQGASSNQDADCWSSIIMLDGSDNTRGKLRWHQDTGFYNSSIPLTQTAVSCSSGYLSIRHLKPFEATSLDAPHHASQNLSNMRK